MSNKPTYLGMLNAIAVGERRGFKLFSAWAKTTKNQALAAVLTTVATRELEHFAAFRKRLDELGFQIRSSKSKSFKKNLKFLKSNADDLEKFDTLLDFSKPDPEDPFKEIFKDTSIDPATGALLGRFIAEERLSLSELRGCWRSLHNDTEELELDAIKDRLERLTSTLEELKSLRSP